MIGRYAESMLLEHPVYKRLDRSVIDFSFFAALPADQMVMRFDLPDFVDGVVADLRLDNQLEFDEEMQRAVDGRSTDRSS